MTKRKIDIKLNELLYKKNMSLTKLSVLTGIEIARLSELANNKKKSIYLEHICKIAEVLEIEDIQDFFQLERDEQLNYKEKKKQNYDDK
ncbi:helix-turn-helix domain-containing protein [Listeria seeligeri]|uniref:helix-turn-helix domain-containing protein n=1 Tax=Listeria seeligeri TaxID=1640 RepID=UPI0019415916|nr:helix-turn-helix transcriptional regulator [Listeria seeligeri]